LESDALKVTLAKVLPKHVTPERMARVAITALTRTPMLAECDQASFFRCLMDLSQWGLEPDGRRAHLIPFRNNKKGIVECQVIIDYKGLVELCYRSGYVANIHADVVCENDDFEFDRGEVVRHKIDFRQARGAVYAAYAIVTLKDGTKKCEVLSKAEIEGIRARSKSANGGPWVTDWNEMAKKTAFRRVSKWIPLSAEIRDAVLDDDDTLEGEIIKQPQAPRLGLDDLTERLIASSVDPEQELEAPVSEAPIAS
jgi:recombination protein RecT